MKLIEIYQIGHDWLFFVLPPLYFSFPSRAFVLQLRYCFASDEMRFLSSLTIYLQTIPLLPSISFFLMT